MKCEIEFLAVGEGEKAGDAIVIRYGDLNGYQLMLVDGGHAETGAHIVAQLKKYFGSEPVLEHVVLTHSDADHVSGIRTVLREIKVKNIWLHLPWLLAEEARHLFNDKRFTEDGLREKIKAEYPIVSEIFDLARSARCNVYYPFAGDDVGPFKILSPHRDAYCYLLPQFEKTPDPDRAAIEAANMWLEQPSKPFSILAEALATMQGWVPESWEHERLKDGGVTSASNESSVVLYGMFEDGNVLLTGDAGVNALTWAANLADALRLPLQQFSFVQIPHHGSRRNVGPTILDRLLGPKRQQGLPTSFNAFVSAPKNDAKHPRRIVMNAFTRRGAFVTATQGQSKIHWGGFPVREDYSKAVALPFYSEVEEYT